MNDYYITGALVIFIVDGRWSSFTIADSLVVIVRFLDVYRCYRLMEGCCNVGRQRNNREIERIKF
jgi:hypothetical protein